MLKIVEIAKAWLAAANPTPEQAVIAQHRVEICEQCPHKSYVKALDMYICGKCGCPLNKKIFSPLPDKQSCPDQRWEK